MPVGILGLSGHEKLISAGQHTAVSPPYDAQFPLSRTPLIDPPVVSLSPLLTEWPPPSSTPPLDLLRYSAVCHPGQTYVRVPHVCHTAKKKKKASLAP